jgi:internalin A
MAILPPGTAPITLECAALLDLAAWERSLVCFAREEKSMMMQRMRTWLAICFCFAAAVADAALAGPFPDKNLETAVRATLFDKRDPNTELTDDDLRKVFILEAKGKQIRDLTGLEKCTNLALINLAQNEVADINPIKNLANLQSLDLSQNKLVDVAPLAGLKALQYVELSNNQITALPSLEALNKLSALYMADNKVADLAPLAKLTKLSSLDLAKNQVSNLAPLAEVKDLSLLKLSDNQIEDISAIGNFKRLSMLFLERNKIKDLSPLVASAKADAEGEKRFAPYLRLYLADNPLSDAAKTEQINALKGFGVRVQ